MSNDVLGAERSVLGFNKIPNRNGNHLMEVEYILKPIDLDWLRKIFIPRENDPDLIDPYDINEEQAKALQPYVIDGIIDLSQYFWELHCFQADGWDWSEGYPRKIKEY